MKKYHIDVIHANSGAAGIIAARVKRNTSVPVVYTAHGILGNMEKEYVIDQLDQIICVSEYVRQDSIARGLHENHLLVRYSGIDTERFTANEEERIRLRKEFGFDEDTLVLAIVSRIKIWNIKATAIFSPCWTNMAVKKIGSSLSSEKGTGSPC